MKERRVVFFVLASIISVVIGFQLIRNYNIENSRFNYTGSYQIDMKHTIFGDGYPDSNAYGDLLLGIDEDKTFYFSREVPFNYSLYGTYEMLPEDVTSICNFTYANTKHGGQLQLTNDGIFINSPTPKDSAKRIVALYFSKFSK